ncbi:MAG: hypothetical protein EXR05_06745 [Acetobacteraceae bacterium]|nr:hypothetical protein [Acetobacteraceae bacterium]
MDDNGGWRLAWLRGGGHAGRVKTTAYPASAPEAAAGASPVEGAGGWRGFWPVVLPVLLFLPMVLAPPVNHDVAAVLAFAQRWLGGEKLYSELIDVNPPLIFILNLLPAGIAALTPLDGVSALRLCVLAFGGFAWFLALRTRWREAEGAVERAVLDVLPVLFLLGAGYDFGQREHLMAVGALPYVLCAAQRAEGRRPRNWLTVSILAAMVFALKPHFLAVPALVEIGVLGTRLRAAGTWGQTLRDPVPWVLAAIWGFYLASVPLIFPDYAGVVLPLVWDFYVGLGGLSAWQVLLAPRMLPAVLLLAPFVGVAVFWRIARGAPRIVALAAIGAAAAAMAQHKGWSYHILPLEFFACALAVLVGACWLDRDWEQAPVAVPRRARRLIASCAMYFIVNGEAPWKQLNYAASEVAGLAQLMEREATGERVLVLSPGIYPIYPAVNYADVVNTLRTMNMWLLQAANDTCLPDGKRYRDVWEMGRAEFFVYRTVAEDFARAPPAVVVVDRQPGIPWCGEEFSFIGYFGRHPLFAEVWSHYQLTAERGRYLVFTRKD